METNRQRGQTDKVQRKTQDLLNVRRYVQPHKKIQISSTLRHHLSMRQTNIQKFDSMLCGETGTLTQF